MLLCLRVGPYHGQQLDQLAEHPRLIGSDALIVAKDNFDTLEPSEALA